MDRPPVWFGGEMNKPAGGGAPVGTRGVCPKPKVGVFRGPSKTLGLRNTKTIKTNKV